MVERKSANGPRYGGRYARIARAGAWLLVAAALAAPAHARAADRDAQPLWDAYPLHPARDGTAPASPSVGTSMGDATAPAADGGQDILVPLILAMVAGAIAAQVVAMKRSRASALPRPASGPETAPRRSTAPRLWARTARAMAAEPATPEEPPPESPPPPAGTASLSAPPEPERAWAAEIGWHLIDTGSQFRLTARPVEGGDPVTLAVSEPLEWPPRGSRSVQALTEAVRELESSLVAAGWSALPRGSAWYAKRYTWQPGARPRPALAAGGRARHRELYDAEYRQQVERTAALRQSIAARVTPPADRDAGPPG